jgi:hypothetical protein
MRRITISERHGARNRRMIAAAFWTVVGIVAVIALGDTLTVLVLALAAVTTARWIYREVEHRVNRTHADPSAHVVGSPRHEDHVLHALWPALYRMRVREH